MEIKLTTPLQLYQYNPSAINSFQHPVKVIHLTVLTWSLFPSSCWCCQGYFFQWREGWSNNIIYILLCIIIIILILLLGNFCLILAKSQKKRINAWINSLQVINNDFQKENQKSILFTFWKKWFWSNRQMIQFFGWKRCSLCPHLFSYHKFPFHSWITKVRLYEKIVLIWYRILKIWDQNIQSSNAFHIFFIILY